MAETQTTASQNLFEQFPVSAIVLQAAIAKRLSGNNPLSRTRGVLSHGFTVLLIVISLFGLYQITAIAGESMRSPSAPSPASAVVAPVEKIEESSQNQPAKAETLTKSPPTQMSIPAINLTSSFVPVGQNSDGSMEVPGPEVVGYYKYAPTPGEIGPAIFVGHVDDALVGPAIFYNLNKLNPGDEISVTRQDGTVVTFIVEKAESYEQDNFPTQKVYGNLDYPGLRLITCDGQFNPLTRGYSHNLVVYARIKS